MSDLDPTPAADIAFTEVIQRCTICRALIDREDLFCSNCGAEAPETDGQPEPQTTLKFCYKCQGCGASMSYDASVQNLKCPFCGSERMDGQEDQKSITPQWVIPFATDHSQVQQILKKWLGSGFWRPSDLVQQAVVSDVRPVYVPYWAFSANTWTYWTADSSDVPWGASGDWRPVTGEHRGSYRGVLVGASSVLTPVETQGLCPFNLSQAVRDRDVDLDQWIVEQVKVQRKFARPQARTAVEVLESKTCQKYVPGRCRNMHVNVRLSAVEGHPVLLPIWILAYRYKGQLYRFLINGQTGRHFGDAPFSWWKVVAVGLGIIGMALFAMLVFGLIAALGG